MSAYLQKRDPDGYSRLGNAWAIALAALLGVLYTNLLGMDLWLVSAILLAITFLSPKQLHMGIVDWNLLLIAVFEIPSAFFSQYRANSIRTSWAILVAVLVFYAIRLTIRTPTQIVILCASLSLGGAWLASLGIHQFSLSASRLSAAGFTDLLPFRSRLILPRAPWLAGEWFTVLLLGLPFACALPAYLCRDQKKWVVAITLVPAVVITAALFLSLSRSVFWSTVLFYSLACVLTTAYRITSVRIGGILFVTLLGAFLMLFCIESAMYPGLGGGYVRQHISQTRSTQGRLATWSRSLELVHQHPLLGIGSGNTAFALLSNIDEEETTGFASRTFSLPVQLLVEKGVAGFLLYGAFVALICREFIRYMESLQRQSSQTVALAKKKGRSGKRNVAESSALERRKTMACCFMAGLVSVLFRELTYSSLLEHSLTLILFFTLAALSCTPERA